MAIVSLGLVGGFIALFDIMALPDTLSYLKYNLNMTDSHTAATVGQQSGTASIPDVAGHGAFSGQANADNYGNSVQSLRLNHVPELGHSGPRPSYYGGFN